MRVPESQGIHMADTKKPVEKPEKTVEEMFKSTVRNLLKTPPKLERFNKKKAATKAAPESKDQSRTDNLKIAKRGGESHRA